MAKCTEDDLTERAKILYAQGLSHRKIAPLLGVSKSSVGRWVNPVTAEKHRKYAREKWAKNPGYREEHGQKFKARYQLDPAVRQQKQASNKKFNYSAWQKHRYATNIQYKLSRALRRRVGQILKAGSAVKDLGCSVEFLKQYLTDQFQDGMSWENHGQWHIDHKKPLASFNLADRKQFLEACHYTNLQPLWAVDNQRKGANYAPAMYA